MPPLPLFVYVGLAGLLLSIIGSTTGFFVGQSKQKEKDRVAYEAQLSRQVAKSAQSQFDAETRLAVAEANFRKWTTETYQPMVDAGQKVVVKYANSPAKKCVVNDELQRAYAQLVVVHSQQVSGSDRVSTAVTPTGGTDVAEGGEGNTADVAGTAAEEIIDDSVTFDLYNHCLDDRAEKIKRLKELSQWERDDYVAQMKALGYTQ